MYRLRIRGLAALQVSAELIDKHKKLTDRGHLILVEFVTDGKKDKKGIL